MSVNDTSVLQHTLQYFAPKNKQLQTLQLKFNKCLKETEITVSTILGIYDQLYPLLEQELWQCDEFNETLQVYQSLFQEQEILLQQLDQDERYDFILSIPIADRPQHLRSCLESIYQLCRLYGYGGKTEAGIYKKITVIVAEDSKSQSHIQQHMALAEEYTAKGLKVIHFGQSEQYELMQEIPADKRQYLNSILSAQPRQNFYLKGQAANRNLSYLKFLQLTKNKDKMLYYLVDSDQSFMVNRQIESGQQYVSAINYFYYINRIFTTTDTAMLTGKLVGDPPVSPSVMAANFVQDVTAFLQQLAETKAVDQCRFHQSAAVIEEAAYHDMANLFGFESKKSHFDYHCSLSGTHNNLNCLSDFSDRINAFFSGEHLTRKTSFSYQNNFTDLAAARTIYPGNYIVNYEGLKYIIPFGDLRLRMSGPTAGRLIQAEIKQRFRSVNMPMLHTRTLQDETASDFRPGVEKQAEVIDVNDEFERQFFGDLMLFTVVKMAEEKEINEMFELENIKQAIDQVETELLDLYQAKHKKILQGNQQLESFLNDDSRWWNSTNVNQLTAQAISKIQQFINNIDLNFGRKSEAYSQIQSSQHREIRKKQIINALLNYRKQRAAWDSLFS